jgi:primase-polymerase (primpol)-like protein
MPKQDKPTSERKAPKERKQKKQRASAAPLSDEVVLERALAADKEERFSKLWSGQWEKQYASQSEADMALCCKLAFWTGKNRVQMDRLFRQSKLFREKWDERHHANGATYGEGRLGKQSI